MFPTDWCTPHLWSQISKEPVRARTPLTGEHRVDVAIIGGGFTGLSTAMSLAEAGLRTIVFETNAIGSAASGHNNGLIIPHRSKAASAEIRAALGTVRGSQRNDLVREAPHDAFADPRAADPLRRRGSGLDSAGPFARGPRAAANSLRTAAGGRHRRGMARRRRSRRPGRKPPSRRLAGARWRTHQPFRPRTGACARR